MRVEVRLLFLPLRWKALGDAGRIFASEPASHLYMRSATASSPAHRRLLDFVCILLISGAENG